jgi:hypothetical protein
MGARTVRLDDDTERVLARLLRLPPMSIPELPRPTLVASERVVREERSVRPWDVYSRLDLGRGGWAVAPASEAKRAVRALVIVRFACQRRSGDSARKRRRR